MFLFSQPKAREEGKSGKDGPSGREGTGRSQAKEEGAMKLTLLILGEKRVTPISVEILKGL